MDNDQLTKKGMELCQKGQFLQAVEYFQVVIENDPNKEEAYLWLADTYEGMGKSNMAKSTVYKLLSINPTNKNAIKKIKSLDKATPISTVKGFNRNNSTSYKVELGRGRAIDCDLYLRFDGGGEVLLNIEGTTATVIQCHGMKELHLPRVVQFNRLNYPITKIDDKAFSFGNGVNIYLPDTLQEIGDKAFACSGLKHIGLSTSLKRIGNEAFYSCESLKDIVIPDSVVEIGKGCFRYCKYLESIIISANVTVLNDETFYLCESLKSINIPEGIVEIGRRCFDTTKMETVTIPNSVKEIKDFAF